MWTRPCNSYGYDKNNADACENGLVTTESTQDDICQSANELDHRPQSYPGTVAVRQARDVPPPGAQCTVNDLYSGGHLHGRLAEDRG